MDNLLQLMEEDTNDEMMCAHIDTAEGNHRLSEALSACCNTAMLIWTPGRTCSSTACLCARLEGLMSDMDRCEPLIVPTLRSLSTAGLIDFREASS